MIHKYSLKMAIIKLFRTIIVDIQYTSNSFNSINSEVLKIKETTNKERNIEIIIFITWIETTNYRFGSNKNIKYNHCNSLTSVTIFICFDWNCIFSKNINSFFWLLLFIGTNYIFPSSIIKIVESAFQFCKSLKKNCNSIFCESNWEIRF